MSSRQRVLLIEDNLANSLLVDRVLVAAGYEVIHALDGESGIKPALESDPDLILIDLGLPDIDGHTLLTMLKRLPELGHKPIVAITAYPEETTKEAALRHGFDGYIAKPIEVKALPEQIASSFKPKN